MASVTHRVTTPDTGNTPNTSGAFAPAVGDLLIVFVTKEASALSSPMASADLTSSVAPTGFTLIRNQGHQSSAAHVGVFVANGLTVDTTSRTVTIASGSDAGAGTNITVYSVSGMTRVDANAIRQSSGQTDQSAGTPAPVFGSAALTANAVLGCIYNATNPAGLTPPSGWTETAAADSGYTTGQVSGIESCFRNSGETGTTITWGSASASAFASIIIELDTTSLLTGTMASTLPKLTASMTGTDARQGTLASNLPIVQAAMSGKKVETGTIASNLPILTASMSGTVGIPVVEGTLAANLLIPVSAMVGQKAETGSLVGLLPIPISTASGIAKHVGTFTVNLPMVTASMSGGLGHSGTFASSLPKPLAAMAGFAGDEPPIVSGGPPLVRYGNDMYITDSTIIGGW